MPVYFLKTLEKSDYDIAGSESESTLESESDEGQETVISEKQGGCGSSVSATSLFGFLLTATAVFEIIKRKQYRESKI